MAASLADSHVLVLDCDISTSHDDTYLPSILLEDLTI